MSASNTGDFLRLARSWLRIVAVSGVNFLGIVAARAEFCVSSQSSAYGNGRQPLCATLLSYPRQYATALGSRLWKW
jgi:hypothetical protein